MSQPGETDGYTVEDHIRALHSHGVDIDEVVVANDDIPENILDRYLKQDSTLVKVVENKHDYNIIYANLLDFSAEVIRHNSGKIKDFVEDYIGGL